MATSIIQPTNSVPVLVHDGDSERCGTFTPEDDSAPTLVVGRNAATEAIQRAAARHGVDPLALL